MLYKWRAGAVSWLLHRITGVGITIFLGMHFWSQAEIYSGPEKFNAVMRFYQLPIIKVGEIVLMAAIIFHAMNGLRIVLVDFGQGARFHRKLLWGLSSLGGVLFIWATWFLIVHM
jgi:succinate dehydrogenase / fumarate reductase cytochrome b subunit